MALPEAGPWRKGGRGTGSPPGCRLTGRGHGDFGHLGERPDETLLPAGYGRAVALILAEADEGGGLRRRWCGRVAAPAVDGVTVLPFPLGLRDRVVPSRVPR